MQAVHNLSRVFSSKSVFAFNMPKSVLIIGHSWASRFGFAYYDGTIDSENTDF